MITGEAVSRQIQLADEWVPAGETDTDGLRGFVILDRDHVGALAVYLRSLEMALARQRDRAAWPEFQILKVRYWWSCVPRWLRWLHLLRYPHQLLPLEKPNDPENDQG